MTTFVVKPYSMSILVLNEDSQPAQLDKAGTFVDDTTRTWRTTGSVPAGYRGEVVKSTNPLLISFKLPQQVCSLTNSITSMNLQLRYCNPNAVSSIKCKLLPMGAKRANTIYTENRTIGYRPAIAANFGIYSPFTEVSAALVGSTNNTVNFSASFPSISGRTVRLPDWMEYIKTLVSADSDPILTFALYPASDVGSLYILEQDSADTNTLFAALSLETNVSGASYASSSDNSDFDPSMLAPVIAGKEQEPGVIKYSAGIGQHGRTDNKPDNTPGIIDRNFPLGEMLERSAHVAPQFIIDRGHKLNLVSNGRFEKDAVVANLFAPFRSDYAAQGLGSTLTGWTPYSHTISPTASISKVQSLPETTGLYASPFGFDPLWHNHVYLQSGYNFIQVETYDSTNSTAAWQRVLSSNKYWQYSTVFQNIGCQLEYEQEYLLEAWVKPYYAQNGGLFGNECRIRLAYLTGFQPESDPDDGEYITHHTGGSMASDDASFPVGASAAAQEAAATWQRLWVKIKLPLKNSFQRTAAFFSDNDDASIEARDLLVSDPPFFRTNGEAISEKLSHGEIRFDVIPSVDSSSVSYRYDTKFLVANVTLTKLAGREYDGDSAPFMGTKTDPIERYRTNQTLAPVALENASYYVPLRGTTTSAFNTSLRKASRDSWSNGGDDISTYHNDKWSKLERIAPSIVTELGGPFASPRSEYLYHFSPSYDGLTMGAKYWRGAHLGLHVGVDRVSILNPNEGTIDFWYCPLEFNYVDPNRTSGVIATHGKPISRKATGVEQSYRPWQTINRFGDEAVGTDNNYDLYKEYMWIGSPKHIMSFAWAPLGWLNDANTSDYWNGGVHAGCCVSFFRQGRMIYCLISETGWVTTPWNNQHTIVGTNKQRDNARFILLKYRIPASLFKGKNIVSQEDTIPSWFNVRLVWGARQELYVNGELVDFNNISGLFQRPARQVSEFQQTHNNYPNCVWMGSFGFPTGDVTWQYPLNHTDSMIITDLIISEIAKSHTVTASTKTTGRQTTWKRLENKHVIKSASVGGLTHAAR